MTATYDVQPARRSARRSWELFRRRGLTPEARIALALAVVAVLITVVVFVLPDRAPLTGLMLPLVIASLWLGPRTLPAFVVFLMVLLAVGLAAQTEVTPRIIGATLVQFLMGLVVIATSFRRSSLGVAGLRGEAMLVDLRDRILTQGGVPDLPPGWHVESALKPAGGTPFAGDFVVTMRGHDLDHLEVVVVDVSGKGTDAGTRALLLSGAFGGLLGAMPARDFLPAANGYLLRQAWDEGFATAVHLSLDLTTGDYEIRTAGHPPAAHRTAASGRWSVLRTDGPVLGLLDHATFTSAGGRLARGDALLLYTDGMVEEPRRDIDLGIDQMLGQAESLMRGSYDRAAARLTEALGSPDDDRALVIVHRT
ncbi:serine/threonine-protein phosphatase [Nocardioides sp. cx-169]|uniref:PP2C family protein-serine/threonine phosphatase n=1 Tax=Nocardioides sp. cx-169 TaxID=2899080 RepID=UPI001E2C18DF|nr:PP2C family protein-serine/threonine phosphatase [Nocardioides sp. cx-169]MCD4535864.1 serine/threonine-protein phosphatase [Nocardioides sp. cx-169]